MDVDGHLHDLLERGDELPGRLRAQQARGVLDHDLVAAHVDQALGERAPQLDAVRGRHRVTQGSLHLLLRLQRGTDRGFHVAQVVEGVENSEHVDALFGRVLDEELDDIVGEVAIRNQVLTADQRLDRRVRGRFVQLAQVGPWILAAPHLGLEGRPAERLHGDEAETIHLGRDGHDLVAAQMAAEQRLLRVAESGVEQVDASNFLGH